MTLAEAIEALQADYLHDVDAPDGWRWLGSGHWEDGSTCVRCFGCGWIRHKSTGSKRITCPTCFTGKPREDA